MILIRSICFNVALIAVTAVFGTIGLPLLAGPRRWICRLRDFWITLVLALLRATVGITHRIEGAENIPKGRFMIASKHQSAWETLSLHLIFPDPSIVLKRELLKLPLLGWYLRKVGMVPIDRSAKAAALKVMMAAARRWSGGGRPILIFPQGTRVKWGENARYHSGVFALYRALDLPVVPVALDSGRFWPRQAFLKRSGTITVRILPVIPRGLDRRQFMRRLETDIESATAALSGSGAGDCRGD